MEYREEPGWHDKLAAGHIRPWFEDLVLEVGIDAQRGAPVDTGALAASIEAEVDGDVGRVGSPLEYARYVEDGHRVAYRDPETGETVFTGEVVPPQPYLRPALFRRRGG